MELLLGALPFLAFLACPLMMVVCVLGMRRMGHGAPRADESPVPAGTREERVAALQHQLREIRAELTALAADGARPSADDALDTAGRPAGTTLGGADAARRPA